MRKAQFSVPGLDGSAPAEVAFFHFGAGQGGSVQANVDRWFKQFSDGSTDAKTERVGNTMVTFVRASGTFSSGMPGGPTTPLKDYAMRGAILESPAGDVYVKMTGPQGRGKARRAGVRQNDRRSRLAVDCRCERLIFTFFLFPFRQRSTEVVQSIRNR